MAVSLQRSGCRRDKMRGVSHGDFTSMLACARAVLRKPMISLRWRTSAALFTHPLSAPIGPQKNNRNVIARTQSPIPPPLSATTSRTGASGLPRLPAADLESAVIEPIRNLLAKGVERHQQLGTQELLRQDRILDQNATPRLARFRPEGKHPSTLGNAAKVTISGRCHTRHTVRSGSALRQGSGPPGGGGAAAPASVPR